jgi:general stress protein CsbA
MPLPKVAGHGGQSSVVPVSHAMAASTMMITMNRTVVALLLIASLIASALEEQRNGEWRYLEFLQVTSLITAGIFMREIPGGTRARHRYRPVDLPEHRY